MTSVTSSSQQRTTLADVIYVDARSGDDLTGDGTPNHPYQSDWWARFRHGSGPIYALVHLTPEPNGARSTGPHRLSPSLP